MPTKPEKAAQAIRKDILDGKYQIGERLPAERALAESLKCTQFTVSKAISILEDEGLVEKKRGSGNYVRNTKTTTTVLFLCGELQSKVNVIWQSVYDGINERNMSPDVHYVLCVVSDKATELPIFKLAEADVIICALSLNEGIVSQVTGVGKPVIWLEEYSRELPGVTISFDNYQAGKLAANHLFALGCRKLAYVQYEITAYANQRRFEGFREGLQGKNEYFNLVTYTWFGDADDALRRLQDLLRQDNDVDGVFCFTDALVPWVIRAGYGMMRQIPGDLSVMGVDGSELSKIFIPPLTTIDQCVDELATKTYTALEDIIGGRIENRLSYVAPQLIVRESTGGTSMPELANAENHGMEKV